MSASIGLICCWATAVVASVVAQLPDTALRYPTPQTSEPLPQRLFWAEAHSLQAPAGRLFETIVNATNGGTPLHRELPFGAGVTQIALSPSYLYWSHYDINSSSWAPFYIGRASLDGSGSYDDKWICLNSADYGHSVFSAGIVWMEQTRSIVYQDEWSFNLIMVSEKTGQPTTLGNFYYDGVFGDSGLKGGLWINGSSTRAIIGIDLFESNNEVCDRGGLLTLSDILTQGSSDAVALLCTIKHPRDVTPFPHSQQVLLNDRSARSVIIDLQGTGANATFNGSVGGGMLSASGKTYVGVSPYIDSAGSNTFNVVAFYGAGDFNRGTIQVQPWFDIPIESMNITCPRCITNVHFDLKLNV